MLSQPSLSQPNKMPHTSMKDLPRDGNEGVLALVVVDVQPDHLVDVAYQLRMFMSFGMFRNYSNHEDSPLRPSIPRSRRRAA